MKSKIILLIIFAVYITNFGYTQTPNFTPSGGEFVFNADKVSCLTDVQRETVLTDIKNNIQQLKLQNKLSFSKNRVIPHPLFIWSVKKKDGHE